MSTVPSPMSHEKVVSGLSLPALKEIFLPSVIDNLKFLKFDKNENDFILV